MIQDILIVVCVAVVGFLGGLAMLSPLIYIAWLTEQDRKRQAEEHRKRMEKFKPVAWTDGTKIILPSLK